MSNPMNQIPPPAGSQPHPRVKYTGPFFALGNVLFGGLTSLFISAYVNNYYVERGDLRRQLDDSHHGYSNCMATMYSYRRRYGKENYAQKFKEHMEGPGTEAPQDAVEVNGCRSLTKDFWRRANYFLSKYATNEDKKTYFARHTRFVSVVRPLDILSEYEGEPEDLYTWKHGKPS